MVTPMNTLPSGGKSSGAFGDADTLGSEPTSPRNREVVRGAMTKA